MKTLLYALFLFVVVVVLIAIGPILSIWALNTLFTLTIPYTFETWAAAGILSIVLSGGLFSSSKK